jgi:hypothetical protein
VEGAKAFYGFSEDYVDCLAQNRVTESCPAAALNHDIQAVCFNTQGHQVCVQEAKQSFNIPLNVPDCLERCTLAGTC